MRIGVAISVYNKGHFVATNLRILKDLWSPKPHVSVCCNDPNTFEKLRLLDIDSLSSGRDLPFDTKPALRTRQNDCIRTSVLGAAPFCDYVIHWHADAFALDQSKIESIVRHMVLSGCCFAARGLWQTHRCQKVPDGDLDDHFFIIRSDKAEEVFARNEEETYYDYVRQLAEAGVCSEGMLSNLVQRVTSQEKIYIYSDMSECEVLPSEKRDSRYDDGIAHRTLPPVNFDRGRKLLHCDDLKELHRIFKEENIDTDYIVEEL